MFINPGMLYLALTQSTSDLLSHDTPAMGCNLKWFKIGGTHSALARPEKGVVNVKEEEFPTDTIPLSSFYCGLPYIGDARA
jgi:hypothetical protein